MNIEIKEVKTKKDLKLFIFLPEKIHKNHENWVHPIYMDEFVFFNPQKNKSYSHSETVLYLAYKNNELVGRIMGIIEKRYNEINNENDARFAFIETYEDKEVFNALINAVAKWAKYFNCDNLVGPLGFSDKDPQGFLIEGFDKPVEISSNANFPYMPEYISEMGFEAKKNLVVYNIKVPNKMPDLYEAVYKRVNRNRKNLKIIEFKNKRQLKAYIKPVLTLLNETFTNIYAFSPFEDYEMEDFAKRYIFVLDAEFIKAIEDENGELVAFIIAMPEISEGVRKAKGRMMPFGIFKVLSAQKKSKMLTLLLGGIKEEYRGKGLDVVLGYHIISAAMKRGFEFIDSHLELEDNLKVRAEMERMGGKIYKRYRIYTKSLDNFVN